MRRLSHTHTHTQTHTHRETDREREKHANTLTDGGRHRPTYIHRRRRREREKHIDTDGEGDTHTERERESLLKEPTGNRAACPASNIKTSRKHISHGAQGATRSWKTFQVEVSHICWVKYINLASGSQTSWDWS